MKNRLLLLTALAVVLAGAGGACIYKVHQHTRSLKSAYPSLDQDVDLLIETFSDLSEGSQTQVLPDDLIEPLSEATITDAFSDAFPEEIISEGYEDELTSQKQTEEDAKILSEAAEGPEANEAITEEMTEADLKYIPPKPAADHKVIFVGDSRTVGMGRAEVKLHDDGCIFIGESGEGYRWFLEHGMEQLEEAVKTHPTLPVVFNLGVNDCDSISSYIEVYHVLETEYPDTTFWYMSVNPVTEKSPHVPNSDVLAFNEKLKAAYPEHYIDTCSWMMRDGFEDVDSVHYTEKQYCLIHDFAVEEIAQANKNKNQAQHQN